MGEEPRTEIEELEWQLFLLKGEKNMHKRLAAGEPAALTEAFENRLGMSLDFDLIEKWLKWLLAFVQFYNQGFKDKNGEYRKPGFWKWASIITALLPLGLKLLGVKKIK